LICKTLSIEPAPRARPVAARVAPAGRPRRGLIGRGLTAVAVVVVGVIAVSWLLATVWALVRAAELVAAAAACGWLGWRLGVRHGRRLERRPH